MKILIDIGHPAHVHYFKNLIWIMQKKGHTFSVSARDKEVTHELLQAYKIPFQSRGKGGKGIFGKFFYMLKGDFLLYRQAIGFKPDIFLSFASSYAAHVSKLVGKPHIVVDDTDQASLEHILYVTFTDYIITPVAFRKDFGKKHLRVNSYTELFYLHPKYFKPDSSVYSILGITSGTKYAVVRFVSWEASHDINHKGININDKIRLIYELQKFLHVFISSENKLPAELEKFKLHTTPWQMHDVLAFSSIFIGESGTMSSEAAMLGVPSIQIRDIIENSPKIPGVHLDLQKRGLKILKKSDDIDGIINTVRDIFENYDSKKKELGLAATNLINETEDFTDYLCNYLESFKK